jgi:hypothetical protein
MFPVLADTFGFLADDWFTALDLLHEPREFLLFSGRDEHGGVCSKLMGNRKS